MKKKEIRKYLRRADDYMEKIEKKMRYIDSTLFFLSLGLEYFCQQEDCQQSNMVQLVKDYLKTIKNVEVAGLHQVLKELKDV